MTVHSKLHNAVLNQKLVDKLFDKELYVLLPSVRKILRHLNSEISRLFKWRTKPTEIISEYTIDRFTVSRVSIRVTMGQINMEITESHKKKSIHYLAQKHWETNRGKRRKMGFQGKFSLLFTYNPRYVNWSLEIIATSASHGRWMHKMM